MKRFHTFAHMYLRIVKLSVLMVFVLPLNLFAQKIKEKNVLRISYYNLNNLYDTLANSHVDDTSYIPTGKYLWNTEKYFSKINNSAQAISSLHDSMGADLIGISGVENEQVVKDLIMAPSLLHMKYGFIFSKGEKRDGLGTAILYKTKKVQYIWDSSFSVTGTKQPWEKPIVDGMHAKFKVKKDIFDIVLIDFPNPFEHITDNYYALRLNALNLLSVYLKKQSLTDGLHTMILGTLSMTPQNPMLTLQLQTSHPDSAVFRYQKMVPLALFCDSLSGTFFKDRIPYQFDQVLLCKALYRNIAGWQYLKGSYSIFSPDWMLHPEKINTGHPYDNFFQDKWIGGYSNHFPISFTLIYAKKRKEVN
ncbi:MAG: hypothetical protein KF882_05460 [Bacteroidia bacterium]|nr:hypothetical protein [Bacteroidia bacterium]MCO5254342.1 hypothetical protein [Bacteroidota bacterium]